jgi:hypothetical protein
MIIKNWKAVNGSVLGFTFSSVPVFGWNDFEKHRSGYSKSPGRD